jgi:SnoaL-like domain
MDNLHAGDSDAIAARLRLLEDKEELRSLINSYQAASDDMDYDGQVSVFTHDGEFEVPIGILRGPHAIKAALVAAETDFKYKFHMITNLEFVINGETATGRGNLMFVNLFNPSRPHLHDKDGRPAGGSVGGGSYDWQFVRTEEGWRVKRQKLVLTWLDSPMLPYAEKAT